MFLSPTFYLITNPKCNLYLNLSCSVLCLLAFTKLFYEESEENPWKISPGLATVPLLRQEVRGLICGGRREVSIEPHGQCLLWHHNPHHFAMISSVVPMIRIVDNSPSCYLAVQGSQGQPLEIGCSVNCSIWYHFCLFVWLLATNLTNGRFFYDRLWGNTFILF